MVDPDNTRVLIRSAKLGGNKKRIWLNLDSSKIVQYVAVVAIVGGVLYGIMMNGGL